MSNTWCICWSIYNYNYILLDDHQCRVNTTATRKSSQSRHSSTSDADDDTTTTTN